MSLNRREFLQISSATALGAGLLSGCAVEPIAANAASPVAIFDDAQRTLLDVLGEALVPGARDAGFSRYIEAQLAARAADSLLMIRYLGVAPPYRNFYLPALDAIERWSHAAYRHAAAASNPDQADNLIRDLSSNKPGEWGAPPAAFVYFVLRADAIDAVYGTRAGFARLGIPYMAHIEPTQDW
jgi:Gluconate 2-dehydrogenase subunit 3